MDKIFLNRYYKDIRVPYVKNMVPNIIPKTELRNTMSVLFPDGTYAAFTNNCMITVYKFENLPELPIIGIDVGETMTFPDETYYSCFGNMDYMISMYNYYITFRNNNAPVAVNSDIKNNDYWLDYLNLKSDDGCKLVPVQSLENPYKISISSRIPSLSKQDNCDILVYDLNRTNILVELVINKKKIHGTYSIFFNELKI